MVNSVKKPENCNNTAAFPDNLSKNDDSLEDDEPEPGVELEEYTIEIGGGTARESEVNFELE